jgi:regulator of replication initiation timing
VVSEKLQIRMDEEGN